MRVLIMDDKKDKAEVLFNIMNKECQISDRDIDIAYSINKGREFLSENDYDLIVLDLVMPDYDNDEPNDTSAPDFIDEIYNSVGINKPGQIIGLTAYDDKIESFRERFEDELWFIFPYSQTDMSWKKRIKNKVYYIQRRNSQLIEIYKNRIKFDIGIICALPEEYSALIEAFNPCNWESTTLKEFPLPIKTTKISTANGISYNICAVCVGESGLTNTAIVSTEMFTILKIDKLFMTGICAGIESKDLQLGDIIIAQSSQDYSIGKLVDSSDKAVYKINKEVRQYQASISLLNFANQLVENKILMEQISEKVNKKYKQQLNIKAKSAPVVSGPYVIASEDALSDFISNDRKICGVDMECYGLYCAGNKMKREALWIKGISDFANSKKNDEYHAIGSYVSGLFLKTLITEIL